MKINITIELTREEVLSAITGKVQSMHSYGDGLSVNQEALSIQEYNDNTFLVEWGEKLEAQDDVLAEKVEPKPAAQAGEERRQPGEPAMF